MNTQSLVRSQAVVVCLGIALLVVASRIQIPLQPVPITLQTLAVMLIGLTFPKRAGLQAVGIYIMLGMAGMPVLAGPFVWLRAGYLLGFILAVWVMGLLRERMSSSSMGMFWLTMLGTACVFAVGVPWLAAHIGLSNAIALGFMPFVIPGIIKGVLLVGALRFLKA